MFGIILPDITLPTSNQLWRLASCHSHVLACAIDHIYANTLTLDSFETYCDDFAIWFRLFRLLYCCRMHVCLMKFVLLLLLLIVDKYHMFLFSNQEPQVVQTRDLEHHLPTFK